MEREKKRAKDLKFLDFGGLSEKCHAVLDKVWYFICFLCLFLSFMITHSVYQKAQLAFE